MSDELTSNTGTNTPTNKGHFVKGDPRINRKGRPPTFDALRELAQQIAHEKATRDGKSVIIDGHTATNVEMLLRSWVRSDRPQLQQAFIEVAFGKVPDDVRIRLGNLTDEQLVEVLGPIATRLGISLVAPVGEGLQDQADSGDKPMAEQGQT
jgi:hypothetical protein